MYCKACLEEWRDQGGDCPRCRGPILGIQVQPDLQEVVDYSVYLRAQLEEQEF